MAHDSPSGKPDVQPWLAVIWTVVWPGLGHFYAHAPVPGFAILVVYSLCLVGGAWCFLSPSGPVLCGLSAVVFSYLLIPVAAIHVFRLVRRNNLPDFEARRRDRKDPWLAAFLSSLLPGVGHFYLRAPFLAIAWILFSAASMIIASLLSERMSPSVGYFVIPWLMGLLRLVPMGHAFFLAAEPKEPEVRRELGVVGLAVLVSVLVTSGFNFAWLSNYETRALVGRSMQPALMYGDRVVVRTPSADEVKVGDMVVFHPPHRPELVHVMRLAAVGPGSVRIRKDGKLEVEGAVSPLPEPLRSTDYGRSYQTVGREWVALGSGDCFVLADNPERSVDSRLYGPVPLRNVRGVVYKIFWPLDRAGPVARPCVAD